MALNPGAAKVSFGFKKAQGGAAGGPAPKPSGSGKPFGFSLGPALAKSGDGAPPARKITALGDDDDDDAEDSAQQGSGSKGKAKAVVTASPFGQGKAAPASKIEQQTQQAALQVDASIFDYDAAYDRMQQAKQAVQSRKDAEKAERKPKYISGLFETAELRKRDHARAEAKKYQREREAEGDEFEGTEAFVTDAYREHLAEIKKLEEQEAREEEAQRARARAGGGAAFFKDMMRAQDADHLAVMRAASTTTADPKGKARATDEDAASAPRQKSDLELAAEARARGLRAELNDEGELVDKRDILGKGLNIIRSDSDRDRGKDMNLARNRADAARTQRFDDRASHDARRAQRERQTRLIEEQMLQQEAERAAKEARELEEKKKAMTGIASEEDAKKREDKVAAARQRALERKRKREDEQKQGDAGAPGA